MSAAGTNSPAGLRTSTSARLALHHRFKEGKRKNDEFSSRDRNARGH